MLLLSILDYTQENEGRTYGHGVGTPGMFTDEHVVTRNGAPCTQRRRLDSSAPEGLLGDFSSLESAAKNEWELIDGFEHTQEVHAELRENTPTNSSMPTPSTRLYRARLFGSMFSYAYYFLDVLVGTPPQRESVILDTGSSLLAFPCTGCEECGSHLDTRLNPTLSNTGEWIDCRDTQRCFGTCANSENLGGTSSSKKCMYTQTYSEGSSITGIYLSDMVSIGDADQHNPPFRYDFIGCHLRETSLFITQKASGIFGMSFPKGYRQPTLIDSMFKHEDLIDDKIFSICISEDGGLLTVGGYEMSLIVPMEIAREVSVQPKTFQKLPTSPLTSSFVKWTEITSHSAYRVKLTRMEVNGVILGEGDEVFGKTIVDSGTTYSYFPPSVFGRWRKVLGQYCTPALFCQRERDGRPCWRLTSNKSISEIFPTVSVQFGESETILWTPESYLYRRTGGFWCDGFDDNRMEQSVLGLSFFKFKQIIFDRENDKIGIVNANCPNFFLEERPAGPDDVDITTLPKVDIAPESLPLPLEQISSRVPPPLPEIIFSLEEAQASSTNDFWLVATFLIFVCLSFFYMLWRCCKRSPDGGVSPQLPLVRPDQQTREERRGLTEEQLDKQTKPSRNSDHFVPIVSECLSDSDSTSFVALDFDEEEGHAGIEQLADELIEEKFNSGINSPADPSQNTQGDTQQRTAETLLNPSAI